MLLLLLLLLLTSNVTSVTEVRSASARLFAGTWRTMVLLPHSIMLRLFLSSSVVSRAFSALCVYSKFGHHPYPYIGYLCAKFRFFRGLHF